MKLRLINSSIPEEKGLGINNPGKNQKPHEDIRLTNSNIQFIKVGHNLTTNNLTVKGGFQIYNNHGGELTFNDTTFNRGAKIVQFANISINGNVSFGGEFDGEFFGALQDLKIIRKYPVDLPYSDIKEDDKESIRVTIRNSKGTEIENTSYQPGTNIAFPEVRYNLSNYNQSFTLTIQQGNRSTSRPLTLTTDTPIKIHDEAFSTLNVTDYTAEPTTVTPSENVTITATVENEGDVTDQITITFYADGDAFDNEIVELSGGENTKVSAATSFAEGGSHTVSVNGLPETEIQVQVPETLRVGPDQDYATIQSAVDAANAGNTVIVYPGTYTESVTISNSITLRAAQNTTDAVIVDAGGSGGVITLHADGTRVDGLTLTNPQNAYGGVRVFSDQNVVTNTTFANMGTDIVFGSDAKENHFYLNTFEDGTSFFYLGENTTPRTNHWNTTQPVTYWYNGSECTGRLGNYHPNYDGEDTDLDDDGKYEDVNGDGTVNVVDVQALFYNREMDAIQNNTEAFDYNDDGEVNVVDVQVLFNQVSTPTQTSTPTP
ncbi:MAG: NosD domain-containing protein, partial [Halobacteriaceae archaeon]